MCRTGDRTSLLLLVLRYLAVFSDSVFFDLQILRKGWVYSTLARGDLLSCETHSEIRVLASLFCE